MHTPMAVPCVKRAFVLACVCRHATWSKTGSITAAESRGVELALSVEEYRGCIKAWWILTISSYLITKHTWLLWKLLFICEYTVCLFSFFKAI